MIADVPVYEARIGAALVVDGELVTLLNRYGHTARWDSAAKVLRHVTQVCVCPYGGSPGKLRMVDVPEGGTVTLADLPPSFALRDPREPWR